MNEDKKYLNKLKTKWDKEAEEEREKEEKDNPILSSYGKAFINDVKKHVNQVINEKEKYGITFYVDPETLQPLVSDSNNDLVNSSLFNFIEKHPKYYKKILLKVNIGIRDKENNPANENNVYYTFFDVSMWIMTKNNGDIELNKHIIGNKHGNENGKYIRYDLKFIRNYGMKWSDIGRIYKAYVKDPLLLGSRERITIQDIYETIGRKPKKVDTPFTIPKPLEDASKKPLRDEGLKLSDEIYNIADGLFRSI